MTEFEDPHDVDALAESTSPTWVSPTALPQLEFEVKFFDAILSRNENHVDTLRQQVELLSRLGRHQRALELDRRLVRLAPEDVVARYNLACSLSMVGEVDAAVDALDAALRLGYSDWAHLESDADLDAVRQHRGFDALLAKYDCV